MDIFNKYKKNINKKNDASEITFSDTEIKDELLRKENWKNRRRMAWISFIYIIFSGLILFIIDINIAYIPLITNTQFLCFGIVGSYIGGNVIEAIKLKK